MRANLFCGILGLALAAPAVAAEPEVLAPVGAWEINYDADSCHLLRAFGRGDKQVTLKMSRVQPGDQTDLEFYGKLLAPHGLMAPVEVAFGDHKPTRSSPPFLGKGGDDLPALMITSVRLDGRERGSGAPPPNTVTPEQEAAIKTVSLRVKQNEVFRLQTGSMAKPMQAMRSCLTDLVRHWGYDPAVQASLSKPTAPIGNAGSWVTGSDYPTKAFFNRSVGVVSFRLDIDETGKVTGCRVLRRTDPDEFEDITCRLLSRRAKMTPALDAQGQPVKTYYVNSVRWIM